MLKHGTKATRRPRGESQTPNSTAVSTIHSLWPWGLHMQAQLMQFPTGATWQGGGARLKAPCCLPIRELQRRLPSSHRWQNHLSKWTIYLNQTSALAISQKLKTLHESTKLVIWQLRSRSNQSSILLMFTKTTFTSTVAKKMKMASFMLWAWEFKNKQKLLKPYMSTDCI